MVEGVQSVEYEPRAGRYYYIEANKLVSVSNTSRRVDYSLVAGAVTVSGSSLLVKSDYSLEKYRMTGTRANG